jgi:Tol biopolymer transport system component
MRFAKDGTRRGASWLALVAAMVTAPAALAQVPGHLTRSSVDSLGAEVHGNSGAPSLSGDARYLAFHSDASDLVPGDTNGDTDVFVRDRSTGVVERVSLAWNDMEARDDSDCPSLSSDGRFVAFRSRAWNMYPGGANLGSPRWDVYLRDRQEGTTTRLTVAASGGDPNADSGCPSISGDGSKIVFESEASNLIAGDGNQTFDIFLYERTRDKLRRISKSAVDGGDADGPSLTPVISRNGRFVAFMSHATNLRETGVPQPPIIPGAATVFLRDLDAGITEAVSLKDHDHEPFSPQENSFAPSISDDGNRVAFLSDAWNLVLPTPDVRWGMYVRDRAAGRTYRVTPTFLEETDCGRPDSDFSCHRGVFPSGRISGDGRWVVFSTRSMLHLPANLYHGDQIYLFDVDGRRIRRLSVEPSGWESDSCSVEPTISADGKVIAYRSTATNLVANDTNQRADVFEHDWPCDDAGHCAEVAACPAEPVECAAATDSLLRLTKRPPGGIKQDQLFWRWSGDAAAPAFPDPTDGARYQLCVYARELSLDVAAPGGPACAGGARPCWQAINGGFKLLGGDGGLTSLRLAASGSKPRIVLRGQGSLLGAPYLPLPAADGLVVQLQEAESGRCWGATLPASAIRWNVAGPYERGTRRTGKLVAHQR